MNAAPFPHLPRWLSRLLLVLAGFLLATLPFLVATVGLKSDFLAFYTGGHAVARGAAAQLYNFELHRAWQAVWVGPSERLSRFVYLPLFATFYFPLATQSPAAARLLWGAGSVALLVGAARLSRAWSGLTSWESALLLMAFPAAYASLIVGQNSPLTLLLFAAIAGLMWRGRDSGLAGMLAGMVLYKPQLLLPLLVLWAWQRRWRALAAFAATGAGVLLGSLLVSPTATWQYLTMGRSLLAFTTGLSANGSLYAELQNHLSDSVAALVAGGVGVAGVGVLLVAWGQRGSGNRYQHAMLWLLPLLITPYIANYDLLLLLLPLSLLAPCLRGDRLLQLLVALVWVGPLVNVLAGEVTLLAVWATLALFALCFWRSRAGPREALPHP